MKICFVICWFGKLPSYLPIWIKTCQSNHKFDFLLFTDANIKADFPELIVPSNIKYIAFTKEEFLKRVQQTIIDNPCIKQSYRLCDFRPMYGLILKKELEEYDFWGYCDIDLVFGNISKFVTKNDFERKDAIFNGGHFTLIKNNIKMNNLFKQKGALFNYKIVAKKEAIYAFDETTGLQRIARANYINARFRIPYIESESKYMQIRSRMERSNPDNQAYFWENGCLYRVKEENGDCYYQEIAYIHLQKRKLSILDDGAIYADSFWITPIGFKKKNYIGMPIREDIFKYNPDMGINIRKKEEYKYKRNKLLTIFKRNPFQIYVRICQQIAGINNNDGTEEELEWIKY